MKKIFLTALFMCITLLVFAQKDNGIICRLGFSYEISKSSNWGTDKPVVTGVVPYSSAEVAGIQPSDIIETIDGLKTTEIKPEEIARMLNQAGKKEVYLQITNLAVSSKKVTVKKECKRADAMTEAQLADAFAMYSLENTNERLFTCPFKITTLDNVDFGQFKTYAFTIADENNKQLEDVINECIGKALVQKGLSPSSDNPDLLIQTFYYFDKNSNYKGGNSVVIKKEPTYRYNKITGKMEKFPFLSISTAETEAEYLLQLGFRFIDRRNPDRDQMKVIWECEANELLNTPFKLEEYAQLFIPLMCMQYPYVKYTRNVQYKTSYKTYNYTGISYDINKLNQVIYVDPSSPAYAAGVRKGDIIYKIGRHKMDYTAEEFSDAYKKFIAETMQYRDPKTLFTDANGFKQCMFWDPLKYPQIADAIREKKYLAAFSYLYYFAPYINPTGVNAFDLEIAKDKKKFEIMIRPAIHSSISVSVN